MMVWLLAPPLDGYTVEGALMMTFRRAGAEVVALAVNPGPDPAGADVRIPAGAGARDVVGADDNVLLPGPDADGRFRVDLPGYGVRALRLKGRGKI